MARAKKLQVCCVERKAATVSHSAKYLQGDLENALRQVGHLRSLSVQKSERVEELEQKAAAVDSARNVSAQEIAALKHEHTGQLAVKDKMLEDQNSTISQLRRQLAAAHEDASASRTGMQDAVASLQVCQRDKCGS